MEDEACYDLRKARDAKYRTHLFYLSYDAGKVDDFDITWVAQLSLDRLQMIEPLCRLWEGNLNKTLLYIFSVTFFHFFYRADKPRFILVGCGSGTISAFRTGIRVFEFEKKHRLPHCLQARSNEKFAHSPLFFSKINSVSFIDVVSD